MYFLHYACSIVLWKLLGIKLAKRIITFYRFGRDLNLNEPKTLADKVAYLEYDESPKNKAKCTDKFEVRSYVSRKGLSRILVPIPNGGGPFYSFEEIDFKELPSSFVLKATHGSGMNIIVKNKEQLNVEQCRLRVNQWLNTVYGRMYLESHYWDISPRVYAEEYLGPIDVCPIDYKIHCFNGTPEFIQVITGKSEIDGSKTQMHLFDTNWTFLKNAVKGYGHTLPGNGNILRPKKLKEMLKIAKCLSSEFKYVRVDLYFIEDKIYFGEMTFTPSGCVFPYLSDDFLLKMGSKLKI